MVKKSFLFVSLIFFAFFLAACDTTAAPTETPIYTSSSTTSQRILFTVSFNLNGGEGEAPAEQIVDSGEKAEGPQNDPARPGYVFLGWCASPEGGELFDFENTPILSDTVLYAGWTPLVP